VIRWTRSTRYPDIWVDPDDDRSELDRDGDWNGAVADPVVVEQAWRAWRTEVAFAERFVADRADLGARGAAGVPLRDVLVNMIEEYALRARRSAARADRRPGRPVTAERTPTNITESFVDGPGQRSRPRRSVLLRAC
jgi:hypothetical protein